MNTSQSVQMRDTADKSALPVLRKVLDRLSAGQVRFGVFKNVAALDAAAAGAGDFDVIVAAEDTDQFGAVMDEFRAVRGVCSPLYDNAVPGRQDWFIPDASGRYLHLDVSFGLQVGPKFNKRYRALEYGDITQWQDHAVADVVLPVASTPEQARIALLRSCFRLKAGPLSGWTRVDSATRSLLDAAFPGDTALPTFAYRLGSAQATCPIRRAGGQFEVESKSIRQLRTAIRAHGGGLFDRMLGPITDRLIHYARKSAFALASRLTANTPDRNVSKRFIQPKGAVVALIGPDGVGKSTQAARLRGTFKRKFRCSAVYMGSNDGAWMALRGRLRKRLARTRGKKSDPAIRRESDKAKLSYGKVLGKGVWRLIIAIQRNAALKRCQRLTDRGVIVIADRWPQALRQGYLDGPSVPPPDHMKLPCWLWGIENRIYLRMAAHKPSLTVHLDCDYATSNARKPDDISADDFEHRVTLMREMRDRDPAIKVVDARQDMDAVTADLIGWVWFAMRQAQDSSTAPRQQTGA